MDKPEDIAALLKARPLLLMLDIDGTLCDIVHRPEDARVPDETRAVLQQLARRGDVHVALVTGRSVGDALRMVGVDGVHIHANHGIEILHPGGETEIEAGWGAAAPALHSTADEIAAVLPNFPGAFLEHKEYSLSVHFRDVDASRTTELSAAVAAIAATHAVRVESGKSVLNIVPAISVDKGTAVMRLMRDVFTPGMFGSILFAGDDVTDEHAFRALADVPSAVTVKVGDDSAHTAARYRMSGPAAVHRLLDLIQARRS
ncbi:MAG: trehalose-phosphatase [Gemmatimonadaceae bacterium]